MYTITKNWPDRTLFANWCAESAILYLAQNFVVFFLDIIGALYKSVRIRRVYMFVLYSNKYCQFGAIGTQMNVKAIKKMFRVWRRQKRNVWQRQKYPDKKCVFVVNYSGCTDANNPFQMSLLAHTILATYSISLGWTLFLIYKTRHKFHFNISIQTIKFSR